MSMVRSLVPAALLMIALPAAHGAAQPEADVADLGIAIEFLDPVLQTTTSAAGTDFGAYGQAPWLVYPSDFWGTYPGYILGQTMDFTVTLTNNAAPGTKPFKLIVGADSRVLELDGSDGQQIGAPQQWKVDALVPGSTLVLQGSATISGDNLPAGLDVTHITISRRHGDEPTAGILKVQTGVWCPPPAMPSANN
jgi:hypothetical protein